MTVPNTFPLDHSRLSGHLAERRVRHVRMLMAHALLASFAILAASAAMLAMLSPAMLSPLS